MEEKKLIVITGPTASGKTGKAVAVARSLGGEIISADSRQVYRGMDLGTGKDLDEYGDVPVHLVDVAPAGSKYNLHRFLADSRKAIEDIRRRGLFPIMCGGTGLYLESVLKGLELPEVPENKILRESLKGKSLEELTEMLAAMKTLHNTTDVDTSQRAIRAIEIEKYYLEYPQAAQAAKPHPIDNYLLVGVDIPREERRARISRRLRDRLDHGMVQEVERLLAQGVDADDLLYYGLEYKYLTLYVTGKIPYSQMVDELEIAIHQFAKRQMTWFRGMEKRGFHIEWLPFDLSPAEFVARVEAMI
ncbi:MAG: tRNA (adenosine(37)-N6)-dimethylallyltransferase MiaA [Clostridium sp.]|nr:tRNA (adenosine(37)-N6)-dimethylallyltransferase MiaA [Clostridium sp.]